MYKVICPFTDLQDNNFLYNFGDVYPREGTHPTEKRISELLSDANMQHKPFIVESKDKVQPTPPKRKRGKKNENN